MNAGVRLIVNSDDFGYAEAIDRGIVAAHDGGIVTSASIMATGDSFEHAAALARARPRLDIGVHLVLTEQRPLTGGVGAARLGGSEGRLSRSVGALARGLLAGRIALAAVRAELDAQICRVRDAGLAVSHVDGHQHVHVVPGVARVVAELATRHGIACVRYPVEPVRPYLLRAVHDMGRLAQQLGLGAVAAASPLRQFRHCDEFAGFGFGGRLNERNLLALLAALPQGRTIELMCHPGDDDMHGTAEWQYQWAAERTALRSERVRELIAARRIELISFPELARHA